MQRLANYILSRIQTSGVFTTFTFQLKNAHSFTIKFCVVMVYECFHFFRALVFLSILPGDNFKAMFKEYQEVGLKMHNDYRALHDTGSLVLDPMLSSKADQCAKYYASIGYIDHSCEFKLTDKYPPFDRAGETLYWRFFDKNMDAVHAVKEAVQMFYAESKDFDFEKVLPIHGKDFADVGHFTQVIWRNSKALGIGYAAVEGNGIVVVGLYGPPGNVIGQTVENIRPPARVSASSSGKGKGGGTSGGGKGRSLGDDGNDDESDDGHDDGHLFSRANGMDTHFVSLAIIFGYVFRYLFRFMSSS